LRVQRLSDKKIKMPKYSQILQSLSFLIAEVFRAVTVLWSLAIPSDFDLRWRC